MSQYVPDLKNIPWIRSTAKIHEDHAKVASTIGRPTGAQRAEVVDVDDPEERGRVRVIFDVLNSEKIPAVEGAGSSYSGPRQGESQISHWIDCSPAFRGRQPKGLIGKRVLVHTTDGELHYSVLADILQDPELLVADAAEKLKTPNNSTMVRLPIYSAGELPPPGPENVGCTVIEESGPMGSDWLCVCLKRNGKYFWVRHVDLSHAHAGGDDGTQPPSASGERQNPVYMGTTSSHVAPTTGIPHVPKSVFSTNPCGNPFGKECAQPLPPMSEISDPGLKIPKWEDFPLLNPDPDFAINFVRNPASYLPIDSSISGFRADYNPNIPILFENPAIQAFKKAQEAAELTEAAGQEISNLQKFISDQSLSLASGAAQGISIPPGTRASLQNITASGNLVTKSLSAITPVFGGILDAIRSFL